MRVAVLSTCAISPACFRSKVLQKACRREVHHGYPQLSKSGSLGHSIGCTIRTQASENFGNSNNLATLLNTLADNLKNTSTEKLEELPWKKASSILAERLIILGKTAMKWCLALSFASSFLSDIVTAVSGNRELMIPLGLFTGVILAYSLKESLQEFFQNSTMDKTFHKHLLGVGSVFVLLKFISLCFNVQVRMLLSHIGNGGLMQVLWLAMNSQQQNAGVEIHEEQDLRSTSPRY